MAKDLKGGINAVFGASKAKPADSTSPTTEKLSTNSGLPDEYDRETFIVRRDLMERIKEITYWERGLLKETVEKAFEDHVKAYIKKNGELKPRPDEVIAREQLRSKSGRKKGSTNK